MRTVQLSRSETFPVVPEARCASCSLRHLYRSGLVLALIAVTLFAIGCFVPLVLQRSLRATLRDKAVVYPADQRANNGKWHLFLDSRLADSQQYYNITLWNVTNPRAVVQNGSIPHLKPVGPYVYQRVVRKFNAFFVDGANGLRLVRFQPWEYFVFRRDMTPAHLMAIRT